MEMIRDEVNLQHIMENAAAALAVKGEGGELSAEAIEANEGQFPPSSVKSRV